MNRRAPPANLDTCIDEGRRAFAAGKTFDDCPYPVSGCGEYRDEPSEAALRWWHGLESAIEAATR